MSIKDSVQGFREMREQAGSKNHAAISANFVGNRILNGVGAADLAMSVMGNGFLPAPIPVMKFAAKTFFVDLESNAKAHFDGYEKKVIEKKLNDYGKKQTHWDQQVPREWFTGNMMTESRMNQQFSNGLVGMGAYCAHQRAIADPRVIETKVAMDNHVENINMLRNKDEAIAEFTAKQEKLGQDYYDKMYGTTAQNVLIQNGIKEGNQVDIRGNVAEFQKTHDLAPAIEHVKGIDEAAKAFDETQRQAAYAESQRQLAMRSNPLYVDPKAHLRMPNPNFYG